MIENFVNKYPKGSKPSMRYGTAGFRARADSLDYVMFRMGILSALRSTQTSSYIGVMITASHNPAPDNGVKLIDPHGDMLDESWEEIATKLVDEDDDKLLGHVNGLIKQLGLSKDSSKIILGKDTRDSSEYLGEAVMDGARLIGSVIDIGIVSTPQLHYIVQAKNTANPQYEPSVDGYYKKLVSNFKQLMKNAGPAINVYVDGANGVGAKVLTQVKEELSTILKIHIYNDGAGELNHNCGADFVKVQQQQPINTPNVINGHCVSFDGDADRIIYFYTSPEGSFHMLDGDRIATLTTIYLGEILKELESNLTLGVVQTAYSNGSSTRFLKKEGIKTVYVPTGVKHLHKKAKEFDIGVYFEANGHGTVLFSNHAQRTIAQLANEGNDKQKELAQVLVKLSDLINQTVGDALSDMLLVETILALKSWSIVDWHQSYSNLPEKQLKVLVKDRYQIKTTYDETTCVSPPGLQDLIDQEVSKHTKARAFIRPSGTEDVVRIYAEADIQQSANQLAVTIASLVYEYAGGVGSHPTQSN